MSRLGGTKTVVICHNVLPHERRPGDVPFTRALLSRADTVITHSAAQAAQARDLAPGATARTVAMPPHLPGYQGTERAGLSAPATARLLFFGIVRPYKGLDVLLRALAQAPAHTTLTVAGEFWGGTTGTEKLIAELGTGRPGDAAPGVRARGPDPGAVRRGGRAGHAVPGGDRLAERPAGVLAHQASMIAATAGRWRRRSAGWTGWPRGRREPAPRADPGRRPRRRPGGCGPGSGPWTRSRAGLPPCGFCWLALRRPEDDRPMASPAPAQARSPTVIATREASATTSAGTRPA